MLFISDDRGRACRAGGGQDDIVEDAAVFPEISGPGIGQPVKDLTPVAVWTVTMEALKTVCAKMIEQGLT